MTITGTVTAPAAAARDGVTGTALAPATPPYVVTPVADRPSWRRHMPCDPGPCRRVPNAPIRIMKPGTSGWKAEPAVSGTTDSNGDFSITVDMDALTKGGPVFIAAWDPDGTFTFMSTVPADLVKAGATLNLPVDRTTTAAAVMHCPGGVYPPPRGGYCYSDPKESTDIEPLNSEIDSYFADNPSTTTDFDAYFPALLNDARVMEALGQVLEANDLPAASAQQVLDSTAKLPTVPLGPPVAGDDKFQFTAPSTLTATAGEEFKYSFCDPEPVHNTSPCGPMPATSNPTGGNPAYHFVLGTGTGFPPFGLSLSKDGVLKGKVAKSEAGKTHTIEVCAVDLSADSVCRQVSITVKPAVKISVEIKSATCTRVGTYQDEATKSQKPTFQFRAAGSAHGESSDARLKFRFSPGILAPNDYTCGPWRKELKSWAYDCARDQAGEDTDWTYTSGSVYYYELARAKTDSINFTASVFLENSPDVGRVSRNVIVKCQ